MSNPRYNPYVHWLAIATAAATFPLLFMGGLVTSHGAGLSVPDWPNSYGYNMFLFPPSLWVGGVFYEHTHRLLGTLVGVLTIALIIAAAFARASMAVRAVSVILLVGVTFQGVLGGLRVVWMDLDLAIVHAFVGQAFFCLTALMVAMTSRWWTAGQADSTLSVGLPALASLCVALVLAQLAVAATMRHYRAGLAIPDFPLHYGQLLPPASDEQLQRANGLRAGKPDLLPTVVTFGQVWLHFAHRIGAIIVTVPIAWLIFRIVRRHAGQPLLLRPAVLLAVLLIAQWVLGILTVLWRKPADIASAHVAVGALVLLLTFIISVRAWRLGPLAPGHQPAFPVTPLSPSSPAAA